MRVEDDSVIVDTDEIGAFRRVVAQIAKEEKARLFEVRGLDEALFTSEFVPLLPSHLVFPDASQRAFAGMPMIVAWTATRPQSTS